MKDHNYITIQGWMVNKLELSGNEVMIYAIIYGFSQDEESKFEGSANYIAESLNISRRQVFTILENLVQKGFIKKIERIVKNLKFCDYQASPEFFPKNKGGEKTSPVVKLLPQGGGEETSPPMKKLHNSGEEISQGGGEETSHHITKRDIYKHTTTIAEQPNSSEKHPPQGETAAAVTLSPEDIKQAILALDRALLSFKTDFYSRAAAFMALHYLDKGYLKWLYKQVELQNPDNFDGFFFTVFFAESNVEKYKIYQQPAISPPPAETKCPVCGTVHGKELEKCPLCSLPKDSSSGDIALFKKLQALPPDKRNEYLQKKDDIYNNFKVSDMFNPSENEKRKNMINALDKEYGIGVKSEEPSLCYRS